MASLVLTVPVGGNAGSSFRKLAKQIERASRTLPDVNATGPSVVLTLSTDSLPTNAICSAQVTGGAAEYLSGVYVA